jgi:hypothetical protein
MLDSDRRIVAEERIDPRVRSVSWFLANDIAVAATTEINLHP